MNVYYQLFDNTISTRMWEMLNNKKEKVYEIIRNYFPYFYDVNLLETQN